MQTLRAGCSKVETKIFAPPQILFPGARYGQNLISWRRSLQTKFGEDRCTQFRVIVVTDPQTNKQTNEQTGPITISCAAARAQCKNKHEMTTQRSHSQETTPTDMGSAADLKVGVQITKRDLRVERAEKNFVPQFSKCGGIQASKYHDPSRLFRYH